jgi:DNA-binding response OmpR family regulator
MGLGDGGETPPGNWFVGAGATEPPGFMIHPHSLQNAPHSSPSRASADLPAPAATIVVVDDDPSLVEVLEDLLGTEGYSVEGFTDPTLALHRLRHAPLPDLAIVDCIMPQLTGTELRAALADAGVEVPVLLMTALSDPSFCVHPGESVLNKPFLLEDLVLEMEARLRPRSGSRSVRPRSAARL